MSKLCKCGCGEYTTKGKNGKYRKFSEGHNSGPVHRLWNGGKSKDKNGYILIKTLDEHQRSFKNGYVYEHILVLEKHLDRPIEKTEHCHHIDGDPSNNDIGNLMLFKTAIMHHNYEARLKAFKLCGHYDWRKCGICHQWDKPENLYIYKNGRNQSAKHMRLNGKCIKKQITGGGR